MVDWAECRTTIGRMDTALEDLRKYGFTLVVGILTAGGFVGSATTSETAVRLVPAVAAVVVVLVLALFALDMYYQVVQGGAVDLALDIEASTNPPVRTTAAVSLAAHRSRSLFLIPVVYLVFVWTAALMAWFIPATRSSWIAWLAGGVSGIMSVYWAFSVFIAGKLHTFKHPRHWATDEPPWPLGSKRTPTRSDIRHDKR